jgi:hypothetical protein
MTSRNPRWMSLCCMSSKSDQALLTGRWRSWTTPALPLGVLAELADYMQKQLADWHLPHRMRPANDELGTVRACARIGQLRRRD